MSQRINRREFSGLMADGMASLSEAAPAWAQPAGTISVRQTAETKRFAEEPALKWQPAEGSPASRTRRSRSPRPAASMTPAIQSWMKTNPEGFKGALAHVPMGRFGDPENDIAPAVLAMVSPDFNFVTGQTVMVDGGASMLR